MKVKTTDLPGSALDWAVAKCEGESFPKCWVLVQGDGWEELYQPSTDWSQGGPIIEREKIEVGLTEDLYDRWFSCKGKFLYYGPTPLVAAMRCYVASKLGEEVELPYKLVS